jgi:hypothetical protein
VPKPRSSWNNSSGLITSPNDYSSTIPLKIAKNPFFIIIY